MSNETVSIGPASEADESQGFDLWGSVGPKSLGAKADLIGGNHAIMHFLSPKKGQKQVNHTPGFAEALLAEMKEPLSCGFEAVTCCFELISFSLNSKPYLFSKSLILVFTVHELLSKLPDLRSLILRGLNILSLATFPHMPALEYLHLSHLLIETLPEDFFMGLKGLRWLILRSCPKLLYIPGTKPCAKLQLLDLSHCTTLQRIGEDNYLSHEKLLMLDVSYTTLSEINIIGNSDLLHLSLGDAKAKVVSSNYSFPKLKVVDLSRAQNMHNFDGMLEDSHDLVALDVSRTRIESIDFLPCLIHLQMRRLTNHEVLDISSCQLIADLPEDLDNLRSLKELNLSGCSGLKELREGLFDYISCLEKLDLSKTSIKHLPSFANLTSLQTLILAETSVETSTLRFDRFKYEFSRLDDHISNMQKNAKPTTTNHFNASVTETVKRNLGNSSFNCSLGEELLLDLMDAATLPSINDYESLCNSTTLNEHLRKIPADGLNENEEDKKKKKKPWLSMSKDTRDVGGFYININSLKLQDLQSSYESLIDTERNCLLYIVICSRGERYKSLCRIRNRILIHLWYGEGFLDPLLNAKNPNLTTNTSLNLLDLTAHIDPYLNAETCSSTKIDEGTSSNIEEIGEKIFQVLQEKRFISVEDGKYCHMHLDVQNTVQAWGKAAHFFNFDDHLTPHFRGSVRACFLKSIDNLPSSCQLWAIYTTSSEKLQCFRSVCILLYIGEDAIIIEFLVSDIALTWRNFLLALDPSMPHVFGPNTVSPPFH
ncbi:LOW QUALITY PROTEIN: hypothetical protein V2J09_000961 [Rumex salicifolius]